VTWAIDALRPDELAAAREVLALACPFDPAAAVADEKLFLAAPTGPARAFAARSGGELVGVAATTADRLRLIAVRPDARGKGAGGALLDAAAAALWANKQTRMRTLDLPGNYLAPGIDERNAGTIAWFRRRGFHALDRRNENLIVDVAENPQVSPIRAAEAADRARRAGYKVRRARPDEGELLEAISYDFGGAWPWEVARALAAEPSAVHVAVADDGSYAAFAAHDGNNQGLGWFGPAGTWEPHRGKGLGEACLLACLVDVSERHRQCEVAWIGPREFYRRAAGIAGERRFVVLERAIDQDLDTIEDPGPGPGAGA
jgi:GNAT superfamily N-acetyltransferase